MKKKKRKKIKREKEKMNRKEMYIVEIRVEKCDDLSGGEKQGIGGGGGGDGEKGEKGEAQILLIGRFAPCMRRNW